MQERSFWLSWAHFLQRWGMSHPAAFLLEAAGPLNVLLAQAVYLGQPLMGRVLPPEQWAALAEMLEDQEQSRMFASFLREEGTS